MNLIDDLLRTFRADMTRDTSTMVDDVVSRLHQSPRKTRRAPLRRAVLATAGACAVLSCGYVGFRILDRAVPPTVGRIVPEWGSKVTIDVADAKSSKSVAAARAAALFRELWRREERVGLTATPHDGAITVTVPEARPNEVSQVTGTFDASVVDLSLPHQSFASVDDLAAWLARQPGERRTAWFRNQPLLDDLGDHTERLSLFVDPDGMFSPSDLASMVASKEILLAQPGMRLATILAAGKVRYVVVEPDQVLASTAVEKIGWLDPATLQQKLMIVGDRAKVVRDALLAGHTVALLSNDPSSDPESPTGHEWAGTLSNLRDENTFVVTPSNYEAFKKQGTSTWSSSLFNTSETGIDVAGAIEDGTPTRVGTPPTSVGEPVPAAQITALKAAPHVKIGDTQSVRRLFTAQINGEPRDLLSWRSRAGGYDAQRYIVIGRRSGRVLPRIEGMSNSTELHVCQFDLGRLVDVCSTDVAVEFRPTITARTVLFGRVRGEVRSIRIVGASRPVPVVVGEDWWISDEVVVSDGRKWLMVEGLDSNGVVVARSHFSLPNLR